MTGDPGPAAGRRLRPPRQARRLRILRLLLLLAATTAASAAPAPAATPTATPSAASAVSAPRVRTVTVTTTVPANPLVRPTILDRRPPAHFRTPDEIIAIAQRIPKIAAVVRANRGSYPVAYEKGALQWQVSYFGRGKEIAQVLIDDPSGQVREAWTGFQVAWSMARGYPGAFGRKVNALYVWIPLSLFFLVPFVDRRRPGRILHLDLLVLWSFSISLAFFNNGDIYRSVPLAYPPLLYLLGRMLWIGLRRGGDGRPPPVLRLAVPVSWLTIGLVFLIGFRIALNVTDANVIDVGYAGAIGAQRITDGRAIYGSFPSNNQHGDTYGPVAYEAYVPFVGAFGFSGQWDDLPAAHAAAIGFDLACIGLLLLIGSMIRGPTLAITLAYAWAAYPFTLFALESDTNDSLVAVLILAVLAGAASPPARGALAALAGLTKVAPLALAPLFVTHGLREEPSRRRRARAVLVFGLAFAAAAAVAAIPAVAHNSLSEIYDRTIAYQSGRGSPFSVWGLYGGLGAGQSAVQIAGVLLAVAVALVPRRPDVVGLAALAAAVVIALQLGITHWFYLYIPWFYAPAIIAVLARYSVPASEPRPGTPRPGRSPGRFRRGAWR